MSTHIMTAIPARYSTAADVTPFDMDTWKLTSDIVVENRYQSSTGRKIRHSLHFDGANNAHNHPTPGKTWENSRQQKAHAFLNPQATMIADSPIHRNPTIEVEIGDLIVLENIDTVLRVTAATRFNNTGLEILSTPAATVDHSDWCVTANAR
jgi:hypothetical protein